MFNQFAPNAQHQPAAELIPTNTLAFVVVSVAGVKVSQAGGRFASLVLSVSQGPYERRKIFSMVGDPTDQNNSEKYQQMSLAALQHMLEAAGIFRLDQAQTYQQFANATFEQIMQALDGRTVAVQVKIEKGTGGYEDKNAVAYWLSPNPSSKTFRKWQELLQGPTQATPPAYGAPAATPPQGYQPPPAAPQQPAPPAAPGTTAPAWLGTR